MTTNQIIRALASYLTIFLIFNVLIYLAAQNPWTLAALIVVTVLGYVTTWYYVYNRTHPNAKFPSTVKSRINAGLHRGSN